MSLIFKRGLQLLFYRRHGVRIVADQKVIVHVEGQLDSNTVVIVQVNTRVELKRDEADLDKGGVHGVEPVPEALGQPVEAVFWLHH